MITDQRALFGIYAYFTVDMACTRTVDI